MKAVLAGFWAGLTIVTSYAQSVDTYLDGKTVFVTIADTNRQSEAWATCAATYGILASFFDAGSAQAQEFKNMGNGAALAVSMTHVAKGFTENISQERFNALWNYSKTLSQTLPDARRTMIMADAERLKNNQQRFSDKLMATARICMANVDGQQMYIDLWRELAKSGMLKIE